MKQRPPLHYSEGRHKTNGQQTEGVICPQGMLVFQIVRSDLKSPQKPLAPFAPSRFKNSGIVATSPITIICDKYSKYYQA